MPIDKILNPSALAVTQKSKSIRALLGLRCSLTTALAIFIVTVFSHDHQSLAASNAFGHKDPGTLIVGTIFPLTGPQSAYGAEAQAGIDLAYEYLQATQAELAKHIEILHYDDQSTPAGAKAAASELNKKRAKLLIGSVTNPSSHALAEAAHQMGKPLIVPAASGPMLAPPSPYVFRSCFVDSWQGNVLSSFTRFHLKKIKAAILYDPSSIYSKTIAEEFSKSFKERGGEIVSSSTYNPASLDMNALHKTLVENAAEILVFPSQDYQDAAKIGKHLAQANLRIPVIGGDRLHPNRGELARMEAPDDLYFTSPFTWNDEAAQVKRFVSAFKLKMHRYPSALAAMTYDAMLLAGNSFKRARSTEPRELRRELQLTKGLPALLGPMNINSKGIAEKTALIMKGGQKGLVLKARIQPDSARL